MSLKTEATPDWRARLSDVVIHGTLHIPNVGITVDLYSGYSQSIVDRKNSAAYFSCAPYDCTAIADHNYQTFANLHKVKKGASGYITKKNGQKIKIKCISAFNGHNTGSELTNNSGKSVMNGCDYIMYTCRGSSKNVFICKWKRV